MFSYYLCALQVSMELHHVIQQVSCCLPSLSAYELAYSSLTSLASKHNMRIQVKCFNDVVVFFT